MNADLPETYRDLLSAEPPWDRSASEVIDHIGRLVDASAGAGQAAGGERSIKLCERLRKEGSLSDAESALLSYFEANAWRLLLSSHVAGQDAEWNWRDEAFTNEIRCLRQAQRSPGFVLLDPLRQSQIHTNLANALDTLGRSVEAIELYNRAIDAWPDHGMARGNFGVCLATYGATLHHLPHQPAGCPASAFLVRAWTELVSALNYPLDPESEAAFSDMRRRIEGLLTVGDDAGRAKLGKEVAGWTRKERRYREWCLGERLFLNPLNDLDVFDEAARDILHLPPIVTGTPEVPFVANLFNQVKQEFATSRFLLYEGTEIKAPHFADRDVMLADTLDYSAHSLCLEKVRIAFRMAYGQFHKIAILLNSYLGLGLEPRQVDFRRLWYENENSKGKLKPFFQERQNWPLRGLFGLSLDLCAVEEDHDALDPDAQDLVAIRNHLEHRHLSVHADSWVASGRGRAGEAPDQFSYAIDRPDFESRALRILKLARSALVYLVHAIDVEEGIRMAARPADGVIVPVVLPRIDDCGKR